MIMATKKEVFKEHLPSYLKADKQQKGEILKHVCFITGMHIKAAIRKFKKLQMKNPFKPEQRGRSEYYTPDVTLALKDIWEAGNEVCGELLRPMIAEYVEILKRDRMWTHAQDATAKLLEMSEATVRRRVSKFKKARKNKKGVTVTKPSHIKHLVPVFIGPWHNKPPGFGQVDTVKHSHRAKGDAVYTVNYTDAATLTTVPRAQWNKGQTATCESLEAIEARLPFDLLGVHPDTGSEFLNYLIMGWCKENDIDLSRSRPNHKNDNMYVEERNGHVIRKTVGYITLDCPEAVDALNDLYDVLVPYLLHFVAVRRMIKKEKLASRYKRVYERHPKTPYQRILEHESISESAKKRLKAEHAKLNPLVLKREMDRRLKIVYDTQRRYGNRP